VVDMSFRDGIRMEACRAEHCGDDVCVKVSHRPTSVPGTPGHDRRAAWAPGATLAVVRVVVPPCLTVLCVILAVRGLTLSGPFIEARLRDGTAILAVVSGQHVSARPSTEICSGFASLFLSRIMTPLLGPLVSMQLLLGFPKSFKHAAIIAALELPMVFLDVLNYASAVSIVSGAGIEVNRSALAFFTSPLYANLLTAAASTLFGFVLPAILYERWYGLAYAARAMLFLAAACSFFWSFLHLVVLPFYGSLPLMVAVPLRWALTLVRDVMVKVNMELAARVRLPSGKRAVNLEFLALFACVPVYISSLYLRVLQITSGNPWETLLIELVSVTTEVRAHLSLLKGEHRITSLAKKIQRLRLRREKRAGESEQGDLALDRSSTFDRTSSGTSNCSLHPREDTKVHEQGQGQGQMGEHEQGKDLTVLSEVPTTTVMEEEQGGEEGDSGKDAEEGESETEQRILARIIPYTMLIEAVGLLHVIFAVSIWRLGFCASAEDHAAGACAYNWSNIAANSSINLVGEIICTDLLVVLLFIYRRHRGWRDGLYSQDLLAIWKASFPAGVLRAICLGSIMLAPACISCLSVSYVAVEPGGFTYLSVHSWEAFLFA
jgi:hypothetical protein